MMIRRCAKCLTSRTQTKKDPTRGDWVGSTGHSTLWTLEDSVTTSAALKALSIRKLLGKRAISEVLPCNWRASDWLGFEAMREKKRLQPKLEPDDRAEAKSKVLVWAHGRRICARPCGPEPREEETVLIRVSTTRVCGRRIQSGGASTHTT